MPGAHRERHARVVATARELRLQRLGLRARVLHDRRAAADLAEVLARLGRALLCNPPREERPQPAEPARQREQQRIGEELAQIGLDLVEVRGTAEIQEDDAEPWHQTVREKSFGPDFR
jgi:hypothetical protein